jgi:acetylglutamate kinase
MEEAMDDAFRTLRALAPHIQHHRGKLFVIKLGGELLADPDVADRIVEQLALLHTLGIRLAVVHGGAPQIAGLCAELGLPVEMINGRRVTNQAVLRAVTMVLGGSLQALLLAEMRKNELLAIGLSGISAGLVNAHRRLAVIQAVDGVEHLVDYGEVGNIASVDVRPLKLILDAGLIPVIAPLGCSSDGEILNVNADTVASALAVALSAEKLIFIMRAPGILQDPLDESSLISELSLVALSQLQASGAISGGMLPKAAAAAAALNSGVARAHFVSGVHPDALLRELLTNAGAGTMVAADA